MYTIAYLTALFTSIPCLYVMVASLAMLTAIGPRSFPMCTVDQRAPKATVHSSDRGSDVFSPTLAREKHNGVLNREKSV